MEKSHVLDESIFNSKGIATVRVAFHVPAPSGYPADTTRGSEVDANKLDAGDLEALRDGSMLEVVRTVRLNKTWSKSERDAVIKKQYAHEKAVAADLVAPAPVKGDVIDCVGVAAERVVVTQQPKKPKPEQPKGGK